MRECCELGPEAVVRADQLWDAWKACADDAHVPKESKAKLGRNLRAVSARIKRIRPRDTSGRQVPSYQGIRLSEGK